MQDKQVEKSRRFSLASESLVPVYGMNKFYKPIKNQSTLTLFTQPHKMSKRKLSFPDQSSIAKWLIKEKKDIFETLSVPLLDDIKLKSQIINL